MAHEPLEVSARAELDRLDPARTGLRRERESLGLAAAGLGVEEQDRPPRCGHPREVGTDTERRPCAGAARHERGDDQQLLEQAVAHQQDDRRAETERADRQAGDPARASSQDAVPGRGSCEGDAGERDQAARELLHHDDRPRGRTRRSRGAERRDRRSLRRRASSGALRGSPTPTLVRRRRDTPAGWRTPSGSTSLCTQRSRAQTPTPALDRAMVSALHAADYLRLSLASAAVPAATGGRRAQRAAADGRRLGRGTASPLNLGVKPLGSRRRPDPRGRAGADRPTRAKCRPPPGAPPLPPSPSRRGVRHVLRRRRSRLARLAASSRGRRVHAGPLRGNVIAGALIVPLLAQLTTHAPRPPHDGHATSSPIPPTASRAAAQRVEAPPPPWRRPPRRAGSFGTSGRAPATTAFRPSRSPWRADHADVATTPRVSRMGHDPSRASILSSAWSSWSR